MEDAPTIRIAGAGPSGFTLIQGQRHWHEKWDTVHTIVLVRVPWAGDVTALAASIAIGAGDRCILAYEAEASWRVWIDAALAALPGMIPPAQWEAELSIPNRGLVIYHRHPMPRVVCH